MINESLRRERDRGLSHFLRLDMKRPVSLISIVSSVALLSAAVILFSCAAEKELVLPSPAPPPETRPPTVTQEPAAPPTRVKTFLQCLEDTRKVFNRCGIDAFPFLRTTFYDIDGDGEEEMIAGGKDGTLRLFKNYGTPMDPDWRVVENYFSGITAGAFSSPAVGDIDNDGKTEVIVGTGGFSSDSGRVLFFRNTGTVAEPEWKIAEGPQIRVGNDAAPTLLGTDNNGRPDLVVGNSEGRLFLFKNGSRDGKIVFTRDRGFLGGARLGMYVVPAAARAEGKAVIIAGNDMGKLYLLEKPNGRNGVWTRTGMKISTPGFSSPALIRAPDRPGFDLVVSDGDGQLHYYKNKRGNYREWEVSPGPFSNRIVPGPACAPTVADNGAGRVITVGNIHGEIKLFVQDASGADLPVERKDFFSGIKLAGFSKGALVEWRGKTMLVAGQQDGALRAFLSSGDIKKPIWTELTHFFKGIPKILHASPVAFDLEDDGNWELIVGDVHGYVRGFRYDVGSDGMPVWKEIEGIFDEVKVGGYAAPSLFREGDRLSLVVGEQDGRILIFEADISGNGISAFHEDGFLKGIKVKNHSSPSAMVKAGLVEIAVGDYDGNLKHYSCNTVYEETSEKEGKTH